MALIQCPECGKEISDQSEICVHCGYPIAKKKTTAPEVTESPVPPAVPAEKQEKKPINKKTFFGVIAALAVMAFGLFVLLFPHYKSYELPYGIQSGMNIEQMTSQMVSNGFVKTHYNANSWFDTQFFESRTIMGIKTDYSTVNEFHDNSQYKISVGHHYSEDHQYGGNNHSESFENIRKQLSEKYGEPNYDTLGYSWQEGKTKIVLYYSKQDPCGSYYLDYMSE